MQGLPSIGVRKTGNPSTAADPKYDIPLLIVGPTKSDRCRPTGIVQMWSEPAGILSVVL